MNICCGSGILPQTWALAQCFDASTCLGFGDLGLAVSDHWPVWRLRCFGFGFGEFGGYGVQCLLIGLFGVYGFLGLGFGSLMIWGWAWLTCLPSGRV